LYKTKLPFLVSLFLFLFRFIHLFYLLFVYHNVGSVFSFIAFSEKSVFTAPF